MTGRDLLSAAVAELYSADPAEFTERRGVLAARARTAGDAAAAKRITELRKPTRSAWVLNQLASRAPSMTSGLVTLGDELRAAQRSLDGVRIRELSVARRELIDALALHAFTISGQRSPPAALRDEVTATLGAALADPQIAEQLQAGALVRAARPDGFGLGAGPALTVVPSPEDSHQVTAASRESSPRGRYGRASAEAERDRRGKASAEAERARRGKASAEAERDRRGKAILAAEQAVAAAEAAVSAAAEAQAEQRRAVRLLEDQLADARQRLDDARVAIRRAEAGEHQARQALGRLRRDSPGAPPRRLGSV